MLSAVLSFPFSLALEINKKQQQQQKSSGNFKKEISSKLAYIFNVY